MEKILPSIIAMEETNHKPFSKGRKTMYALAFLAVALVLGAVPLFAGKLNLSSDWIKLSQFVLFLLLGIAHTNKIQKQNFSEDENRNDRFSLSIQLALCILIVLAALYYVTAPGFVLTALGNASLFLLPFIISSSWQSFNGFSQIQYRIWSKPISDTREKTFIFFSGIALKIKFSTESNDKNKTLFRSLAPLDKTVGDFFNHFILVQRNNNRVNIELEDEYQKPFGWKFYKVDWLGFRRTALDPEATIKDLELKNHETIVIKRVRLDGLEDTEL